MTTGTPSPLPDGNGGDSPWGGDTCNTPPQTSQTSQQSCPATGGEDWLEWQWYIVWSEARWPDILDQFEKAKKVAAMPEQDRPAGCPDIVDIGGHSALVEPGGARLGSKGKGPYMTFKFACDGLDYLMSDRIIPHKTNPSVTVRAPGLACLTHGAMSCYKQAQDLVVLMGGKIVKEKLTRVDLCTDLPEMDISAFVVAYKEDRYITRAKSHSLYVSNGITVQFGADPLLLRIYDKLAELRKSQNDMKLALMAYHRWYGLEPIAATRAEFQVGRAALKQRGIDTVADYFERRADLARYLMEDWIRLTRTIPDRTHTTRAKLLSEWVSVCNGFRQWVGEPAGLALDPLPREVIAVESLSRGIAGTMLTCLAMRGIRVSNPYAILYKMEGDLIDALEKMGWRERLERKLAKYQAARTRATGE